MNREQFDKNIDFLARKAADNFTLSFEEESWDKMELLLDKEEKKKRPIIWWWMFAAIGLFLVGTIFFYKMKEVVKVTEVKKANGVSMNESVKKIAEVKNDNNVEEAEKATLSKKLESVESNSLTKKENYSTTRFNTKNAQTKVKTNITTAKTGSKNNVELKQFSILKKSTQINHTTSVLKEISTNSSTQYTDAIEVYSRKDWANQVKIDQSIQYSFLQKNLLNSTFNSLLNTDSTQKKTQSKKSNPLFSKLDIGLLVGADISSVDTKKIDKISSDFGVMLAYPITKKVSLSTGFAISQKVYSADSNSYKNTFTPNSHYYITNIDAKCLVYEIPVNVGYLFAANKKSSWSGVLGLSSYLMKKESYDYYYLYYGNTKMINYEVNNENNHYFSILNMAVAYRRTINKNFAYQLMPFAKIPMAGIGRGKVNLYTLGLGVSIHYSSAQK